jgi:predicted nucleotidyltransferase
MRLSRHDRNAILQATAEVAGPAARVMLFGSRVHDHLRGGDIDLLIELPQPTPEPTRLAGHLGARIERAIGLRKIDSLIADPHTPVSPVLLAARRDGVAL